MHTEEKLLGYREQPKLLDNGEYDWEENLRSYCFSPIRDRHGGIGTAAILLCSSCRTVLSGIGGPGHRCYCVKCYEVLKVQDFAEGHEHTISGEI